MNLNLKERNYKNNQKNLMNQMNGIKNYKMLQVNHLKIKYNQKYILY